MKILFVSHIFPRPGKPNLGIFSLLQCAALARAGHTVRAVVPRPWTEGWSRQWQGERPAEFSEIEADYPLYVYPPGVLRAQYGWCMWFSCRHSIRKHIRSFRPDCVLSYWVHPDGHVAHLAAEEANIPSAVVVGGSDVLVLPQASRSRHRVIRDVLQSVDGVITVSQHLRQETIALGVCPSRVHVVYQGVDRERFSPGDKVEARRRLNLSERGFVLLFVGSLLPVKGVDILLQACSIVRAHGFSFHAYLLGDGPSRTALERQCKSLDLQQSVTFVGAVPQRLLPDWYRSADLKVLASRSEGIPNVLREAMSCGVRVVSTNVGGIREIVNEGSGELVPPEDPQSFAEAIMRVLASPNHNNQGNGDSWDESAQSLAQVLNSLVSQKRASLKEVDLAPARA